VTRSATNPAEGAIRTPAACKTPRMSGANFQPRRAFVKR
jgi:hypothetical protein